MSMTNPQIVQPQWVQCALCGSVYPLGQPHSHAQTAAAPMSVDDAAPADEPTAADINDRFSALEARMDAVEAWIAEDAMSEIDTMAMAAALPPEPVTAAYVIVPTDDQFCVVKEDDGENMGCHPTADEAQAQIDAIMANESASASTA